MGEGVLASVEGKDLASTTVQQGGEANSWGVYQGAGDPLWSLVFCIQFPLKNRVTLL
jgi:hypothetical protein